MDLYVATSRMEEYQFFLKHTGDKSAAAMLVLASAIRASAWEPDDTLSHQICLGVRKGLFGANAPDSASILDLAPLPE